MRERKETQENLDREAFQGNWSEHKHTLSVVGLYVMVYVCAFNFRGKLFKVLYIDFVKFLNDHKL